MALKLAIKYKGYDAEYWKITDVRWSAAKNETEVFLSLYRDAASRTETLSNVLTTKTVVIPGIDWNREELYVRIQDLIPEFATSEDV